MENNSDTPQSNETTEPTPKVITDRGASGGKKWLTWLLVLLLVLSLGANGYLWMQLQDGKKAVNQLTQEKQQLQAQVDTLKEEAEKAAVASGSDDEACTYAPASTMKDNIEAALSSKDTAAFSTYTTNPVKYVLAASEFGGDISPDEAATSLEYTHSATGPWAFVEVGDYGSGDYKDYFGEHTLVIKSASGMVVAFEFNCDGSKISDIFVAADEDLL